LDGVIVATAPESHCEIAAEALARGLPVLCEKPLALTLEECDRLLETERQSPAFLQVGLEFRHAPVLCRARKWVEEGRLGQVAQVWCRIFRDKRDSPRRQPERWVGNGGVFVEFLCHYFDMLTALSGGAPERVSGVAGQKLGTGAWDHGWLNIEYDNGALGHVGYSLLCPREAERLELGVAGDRAVLEIVLSQGRLVLQPYEGDRLDWQAPPVHHPSKPYPGSFEQIRHFLDCIRSGQASPVNGAVGRQMLSLGYGAERAVRERRPVPLA
jgi:predicted dehydrogenase